MRRSQRGCRPRLRAPIIAVQPSSLGTIAMFVPAAHSSNDLSFSVKIQTKSELEILVLAMRLSLLPAFPGLMQISVAPRRDIVHRFETSCRSGSCRQNPSHRDIADHPV